MGVDWIRSTKRSDPPRRVSVPARSAAISASSQAYLLNMQAQAGNRAVASMLTTGRAVSTVQRDPHAAGWADADQRGEAWNAHEHDVGTIRRIPLDGLKGNQKVANEAEKSMTTESAAGRAIVLIPSSVKGGQTVDVLFHFHGYTEKTGRPYAGWRQHSSSGTVRDVDQDRIEAQLEASKQSSMIAVLPQGFNKSEFGGLQVDTYLKDVFERLAAVGEPPKSDGKHLKAGRLVLSGHSGGGDRIANMLDTATGIGAAEVVLFEAIHGKAGLDAVTGWATHHLDRVGNALKKTTDPTQRKKVVDTCPKLLGYFTAPIKGDPMSGVYKDTYKKLISRLDAWFAIADNHAALDDQFTEVRARFRVEQITGTGHESVIRGLGDDPAAGPLTDALVSLDKPKQTADPKASKLVKSGESTWVPPEKQPKVGPAGAPVPRKGSPVPGSMAPPSPPSAPSGPAVAPGAGSGSAPASKNPAPKAASTGTASVLPTISLTPEQIIAVAFARGLGPLRILATLPTLLRGGDSYRVLAETLVAGGLHDSNEITDTLFDAAHPELGGGRITADQDNLKAQWMLLRKRYARPAVGSAPDGNDAAAGPTTPSVPATSSTTPAAPAAAPAGPAIDTPTVTADPATIRPARAATGTRPLTDDEIRAAKAAAIKQVTTQGKAKSRSDIAAVLDNQDPSLTVEEWFGRINFSASFLDVPIQPSGGTTPGVHTELFAQLQIAEQLLAEQFPGLSKAQIAGKMNIKQIVGVRPPKDASGGTEPSSHCFGLAIDINASTNPFVGLDKPAQKKDMTDTEKATYQSLLTHRSPRVIERAMWLLRREHFDVESSVGTPKNTAQAGKLWEKHHQASETLAEYLRLADDIEGEKIVKLVTALQSKGDTRNLDDWKTLITDDRKLLKHWDFEHHNAPDKTGYMDLGKELVVALIGAGLLWGGSYTGDKDIMHFDWRGGTIKDRNPAKKKGK